VRRGHWAAAFALLLLVSSAIPVVAASASEGEEGSPPATEAPAPSAAELAQIEDQEREYAEWLSSPEAIGQREASRGAYANLSASKAGELLLEAFPGPLNALNADPARVLSGLEIEKPLGTFAALVSDQQGERSIVESSVPIESDLGAEDEQPVDLALEQSGEDFVPKNPLTEVKLPNSAEEPIQLQSGVEVELPSSGDHSAQILGGKSLFYPETEVATDTLIAPIAGGIEVFEQLRSPESPEQFRFPLNLAAGTELRAAEAGGAEVISASGGAIVRIPAPTATDAQGAAVPASMSVEGDALLLEVPHRSRDVAYPILLDPEYLEEGNVSYNQWLPSSNDAYILFNASSLFAQAKGSSYTYGAYTQGQWVYTAPGQTAYVAAATFNNPKFTIPENCEGEKPTNQPHGYAGLYNPSANSYAGLGSWSGGSSSASNYQTGWVGYSGVRQAVVGIGTGTTTVSHKCAITFTVSGATIQEKDPEAPTIDSVSGTTGNWVKSLTATPQVSDPGLGVKGITLSPEGSLPHTNEASCSGTYTSRCKSPFSTSFGDGYFNEGERIAEISAYDPLGPDVESHVSSTYQWTTRIDRSKPEVELKGQLTEAIEEAEEEGEVGKEEVPRLRLPVYNLEIEATDGSNAEGKTKRSGMKDIAVYLDGEEMEVPWEAQGCPESSCSMTETYPVQLSGLGGGPVHVLKVVAEDQVENQRDQSIEFEYVPATGMKDEYVMQYFPLPDGEGNEDEEEHPKRPELAVNVVNGNLVYRQKDVDVEGPAVDLELERFYNSQLPTEDSTEWGDRWTLAQTPRLEIEEAEEEEEPDRASVVSTSGSLERDVGLPTEDGDSQFDRNLRAVVTKEPDGYAVEDRSGEADTSLVFDSTGKVQEERTSGYAKIDYSYEEGDLSELAVDDPASFGAAPPEEPLEGGQEAPAFLSSFGGSGSGPGKLADPAGIALDPEGNVWVADTGHNRIQEFGPDGEFLRQFGATGSGNGQLSGPRGVVFDSEGDIWVLDSGNYRLQKFSPKGEYLDQFGAKGSGPGQFSFSWDIAIDSQDNLWVADTFNYRVQKFSPQGEYLTQLGTKGAGNGQLSEPKGIAIDSEGDVWVADTGNHRVQEFDSEGAFIAAVGSEGTEDGQFSKPAGIAADSEGNVWVTDLGSDRVQEFDSEGAYLSQFGSPGNDAGQLSEPQGIALDPEGNVWVADTDNDRVQEFAASEFIRKFGGEGSEAGQLASPSGIALGPEGNVWVADTNHHRIQQFSPEGEFIHQFGAKGSGPGQFSSPWAIATDPEGNVWVADGSNSRVQEFSSEGEFIRQFGASGAGNGQLSAPRGIAIDSEGDVWVADTGNNRIQEFSSEGEFIRKFGAKGAGNGQLSEPKGIAINAEGHVWVADTKNHRIQEFSSSGAFIRAIGEKGAENAQFKTPIGLAFDAEGNLWVADSENDRIQEFDSGGEYLAQFGTTGNDAGQLSEPRGVAVDAEGNLWVADSANNRVQEFAASEFVLKFGGEGSEAGQLASPSDAAIDAEGNLWVSDTGHNRIQQFSPEGEFIHQFGAKGSGECQLSSPRGIALDAEGDIWVADSGNGRVQEFSPDGACLSHFGSAGKGEGQFGVSSLKDLAFDPAGHIWTVESGPLFLAPTRVQEFDPEGEFIRAFGSEGAEEGQFSSPQGIAVDPGGDIWVADTGNHRVQELDPEGKFLGAFGEEGTEDGQLSSPSALAFSPDGRLWVADSASDRVQEFTVEGDYLTRFGAPGNDEGQFSLPRGMAIDPEGHIWLADSGNDRVQKWQIPGFAPKHSSLFLSSFGAEGTAAGELRHAADVAIDSEGNAWVADELNNRIAEFDKAGEFVATFGKDVNQTAVEAEGSEAERNLCTAASEDTCQAGDWGSADGRMSNPVSVAIDAEGDVWVADKGNHRIEEFSSTGEYLSKFGSAGGGEGQLSQAEGIAIDPQGDIWVADTYNGRVQEFNQAGELLRVVGSYGSGEGQMGEPTGIDIGPGGNVWIADWQNNRVAEFGPTGKFIRQFGTYGTENGQFQHPDGLTIDDRGQIWVADEGNDRVQAFTEKGEYLTQFGSTGSEEEEFNFHWPIGITTNSAGKVWVADGNNDRVQRWGVFNYVPADESFVADNDPRVQVETSSGLVDRVEGEAAGEISYEHEGDLLTSVDGPVGETQFEYGSDERLTKVTLPNGTWGEVAYGEDGRVKSVTVDPAGEDPAKTTYFSYQDTPNRRTTVSPEGEPATVYDIAADGSVFKWWNTAEPPELENLTGSLSENLETAEPISPSDYSLVIDAHSVEGIASIELIANGSTQVDEKTCDQDWETPERECQDVEDLWVTNTGNWAPGILNLEVVLTDANGNVAGTKFWVNIPYTPPPDPEADEPPTFDEVLHFREEFGLDLDLKGDELAIGERIFNLIGDWYNPHTPNGEVARATYERWGVPLRAVDAAELEYQEQYIAHNGPIISEWGAQNASSTYAGYYVDRRQGGVIHVGFTENQSTELAALKETNGLLALDRFSTFITEPALSLGELQWLSQDFDQRAALDPTIWSQLSTGKVDMEDNRVTIGATDPAAVNNYITGNYGSTDAIHAIFEAKGTARQTCYDELHPHGARQISGRIYAGDWINAPPEVHCGCTLNVGAWGKKPNPQGSGFINKNYALTAGHCFGETQSVWQPGYKVNSKGNRVADWGPIMGGVSRRSYGHAEFEFETDAEAILLNGSTNVPRLIRWKKGFVTVNGSMNWIPKMTLCLSGAFGGSRCRPTEAEPLKVYWTLGYTWFIVVKAYSVCGDSGAPIWNPKNGAAVAILSGGPGGCAGAPTWVTPLLPLEGMPYAQEIEPGTSPGALFAPEMRDPSPLHIVDGVN
jgi:sugar lactone lactonase YvrE